MKIEVNDEYFDNESLQNTPRRWERIWKEFSSNHEFTFTTFPGECDEMVILKDIDFYSFCSHHILPFYGKVHIAYIPNKVICGLSKLARTVDKYASRPQLQERMTQQIADFLMDKLDAKGVMVVCEGIHLCMRMRGVKKQNATMVTSAIKGVFMKPEVRNEFLRLIK